MDLETIAVSSGRGAGAPGDAVNVPIHLTSIYVAGGDLAYARDGNPSWVALEEALGALEDGRATTFSSGVAAIAAVVDELAPRGVVVAPVDSYTGTRELLLDAQDRGLVEVRLVDVVDTAATARACEGASLLFVESPTNPLLRVADVPALVQAGRRAGCKVAVDSTFATPLVQRPLRDGADVVVHSATKFLSGHSDVLLGATVTRDPGLQERFVRRRSVTGAVPGPVEAFLALRGLRTLGVRFERGQSSAATIAARLAEHPRVGRVRYPGFGAVLSFEYGSTARDAEGVCERVRLVTHATSLGGVETTMERRRRHPGEDDSVPETLLRVSCGVEHVEDVWADLEQALA